MEDAGQAGNPQVLVGWRAWCGGDVAPAGELRQGIRVGADIEPPQVGCGHVEGVAVGDAPTPSAMTVPPLRGRPGTESTVATSPDFEN
jgi:hypothetical protein